jgi:hypothetical protein
MLSNSSGGKLTMNLAARSSSTPASVSVPNDDCGVAPADVWSLYDILSASIARAVESSVKRERREGEKLSQRDSGDDSPRSPVYTKALSNRLSYSIFDLTRQIPGRRTDRDFPKWQELVNINFTEAATRTGPLQPTAYKATTRMHSTDGARIRTSLCRSLISPPKKKLHRYCFFYPFFRCSASFFFFAHRPSFYLDINIWSTRL